MDIKKVISISACVLTLVCATPAFADGAVTAPTATPAATAEAEQVAPSSMHGGQVLDTGDKYYISISELPACANGAVLVYDKATGELATLATASNISQMVYTNDAIYALTPVMGGVCLIRITDKCEAMTTATVIDQLSVYDGKLYFLADGKLSSINPDGSDLRTLSALNMGQYVIVDGVVYFTNMDDAKAYTVNSKLQSQPLSLTAGCLYSLDLKSGVQVKLLSDGVKSIKALGGEIYLQNMGESYVTNVGDTEQPAGRLCRFDPATRKLEREEVQYEYSYFPTTGGLITHTDYDIALYTNNVYTMSLYKPEQGASVYGVNDHGVMVYEPIAQRLMYVSADLSEQSHVIYAGEGTPEQDYIRPTLSPSGMPQSSGDAAATPSPTLKPQATARPTSSIKEGIIFSDSDTRRLTEKEVRALKNSQLICARYEILARNGYVFEDTKYLKYYRQFDWYHEDPNFKFGDLDTIESYNYELIRAIMNEIFATPTPKPTQRPTPRPTPVYSEDFIFPKSSLEKLTRKQVLAIDTDDLLEARYEILARNGYVFETKSWQKYFEKQSWYSPNPNFKFGDMNEIESYNYELIRAIDKEISGEVKPTEKPEYDFIFPDALERKLERKEVLAIEQEDMLKARYEILARKGYVFETQSWQKYFEKQSWYSPDPNFKFGDMNEIESYNYELIRAIDKEISGETESKPTEKPEYDFIFPDALERKLERKEVLAIEQEDMLKARYEILARKGYVFETQSWQKYFEKQSWYSPDPNFTFGDMTEIESYNYELIRAIDKEISGETESKPTQKPEKPDKPSDPVPTPPAPTDPADAVLLPMSNIYEMEVGEIMALDPGMHTPKMLRLMRDEILARHGYVFDKDTEEGRDSDKYFRSLNWYVPDKDFDPSVDASMNEFEVANYKLLQSILDGEYGDPMEWDEAVG